MGGALFTGKESDKTGSMSSLEKAPAKGEGEKGISSDYDATEHLMAVDEVSAKYGVQVNKEKPGSSGGLTGTEVCTFVCAFSHLRFSVYFVVIQREAWFLVREQPAAKDCTIKYTAELCVLLLVARLFMLEWSFLVTGRLMCIFSSFGSTY